eukprot:COSAG06_NODE_11035_length_1578_cov_1.734956_1_plen_124_part_00
MDDIVETVGNALGDGASDTTVEATLAADSDAVTCTLTPEQVWTGRLLSREAVGRPNVVCRGLQALAGIGVVIWGVTLPGRLALRAGMAVPNELHYVSCAFFFISARWRHCDTLLVHARPWPTA